MNERTRNPDVGGYARQKHGRQRQAPVQRLLPWDGGFPTSGRARTATTVGSASLPCCPSHCFGSLHHVSLLRSEFIKCDDARDLQKTTSEEEKKKKKTEKNHAREHGVEKRPGNRPSQPLHHFDKQPGQVAGGRDVAPYMHNKLRKSDQQVERTDQCFLY